MVGIDDDVASRPPVTTEGTTSKAERRLSSQSRPKACATARFRDNFTPLTRSPLKREVQVGHSGQPDHAVRAMDLTITGIDFADGVLLFLSW